MRSIRIALTAVLALGAAVVVSTPAAHAAAPYTVLTLDGTGSDPVFGADYLFGSSGLTLSQSPPGLEFDGTISGAGDSPHSIQFETGPADHTTPLAVQSYPIVDTGGAGNVYLTVFVDNSWCYASTGTLNVTQIATDGSGNVTAFAADYSGVTCDAASSTQPTTLSGSLRWASAQTFAALAPSPRSWDWGNQLYKVNAQPSPITFTNASDQPLTLGPASITGSTAEFTIKSNGCSSTTLAAGAACVISVVAHPLHASGTDTAALHLQATGLADRVVNLAVEENDFASDYAFAGPQRVQLHWRQLPAPIGAVVDHYRLLRGSSPTTLGFRQDVANSCCPVDVTDTHVTAGTTYYYAVRPVFTGGGLGTATPTVAARPWPKYSAGMYHRIVPSRVLSNHTVAAGHSYQLKLLGQHRVPSSGVSAVVLTLTVGRATRTTDVTVYPRGTKAPAIADVSTPSGATRSNMVIAKVGSQGSVLIANAHGNANVTVDVSGYFSAAGLATANGPGAALHEYTKGGTIVDTKSSGFGPLPHDYYTDAPVNFDPIDTPHVTSLLVQVTAYGSKAGGSITAYATNARFPGTSVLAYSAGTTSTGTAIVSAGAWSDPQTGLAYPSVSFLNRGAKPVQLRVSILGFYDDNTFLIGQRYHPTAPRRLLSSTVYSGGTRVVAPGSYGHTWTTAINAKVRAAAPTQTTAVSMWPNCCGVTAAAQPQLRAPQHQTTVAAAVEATGTSNRFSVHNSAGRAALSVWGFGTFEAWALPSWQWYVGEFADETAGAALPVEHRLDNTPRAARGAPVVVHQLAGVGPGAVAEHAGDRHEFHAGGR